MLFCSYIFQFQVRIITPIKSPVGFHSYCYNCLIKISEFSFSNGSLCSLWTIYTITRMFPALRRV